MFTVEIRINGSQIIHIYGRNIGFLNTGECEYKYEHYETGTGQIIQGKVSHLREDEIQKLIIKILEDANTQT